VHHYFLNKMNFFSDFISEKKSSACYLRQRLVGLQYSDSYHKKGVDMYKQLASEERYYIQIQRRNGDSFRQIAKSLGRHHSTIIREIQRNTGDRGYRNKQASKMAKQRHDDKNKATKLNTSIKEKIITYLQQDWSPEQISGRLKQEEKTTVHHETIYRFLLADRKAGGQLYKQLRHQEKTYRKRYGHPNNRTGIPNRVDIDERPEAVNNREVFGHWEADTIIGKRHQGAIATLDERVSKIRFAYPTNSKHADKVGKAIQSVLKPVKSWVHSITYDNGKEFTTHEKTASLLECLSYFAKPYHSWERGQNENANGLLRQYFPKTMALIDIPYEKVRLAVHKLNSRPRKCLGFKTPYEVFFEHTGVDVSKLEVVHL
jgi:IS30 family transposase